MVTTTTEITKATTDAQSEKDLARSLGYPSSWHVIRVIPHPSELDGVDNVSEARNIGSFNDTIYAGDPAKGVDVYYNHSAALGAAMEWKEGESTGYDNGGGQMLPRVPQFQKDSWVEVYYPDEDKWYKAQVKKVKQYVDDIRYSVYYVQEDATQVVSEDLLRAYNPPQSKKRKRVPSTPQSKQTNQTKPSSSTRESNNQHERINAQKIKRQEQFQKYLSTLSHEQILSRKKMAKDIGLPDNWLAYRNSNYIFDIRNPQGDKFTSKKAALDSLRNLPRKCEDELQRKEEDEEVEKTSKRMKKSNTNKNVKVKDHDKQEVEKGRDDDEDSSILDIEDEGDPPFRKTGHKYLGKTVKYNHCPDGEDGVEIVQSGIVKGWLDSTDVDSSGNPAFISELTGQPGVLFHIVFKVEKELNKKYGADLLLDYVDIEQWELEELMNAHD